jgi:FAD/FMN-containing dehydrogenase
MGIRRRDVLKCAVAAGIAPSFRELLATPPGCELGRITDRDLTALAKSLSDGGRLVLPIDADYDPIRLIWNVNFEAFPLAIVRPRGVADVAAVIAWCRDRGITPRLRSGGHSFTGYSTGGSLVIDTRDLDDVIFETDGTVSIGAGGRLGDIARVLHCEGGVTIPMGTCPTVGISGLTMAGGIGFHMRSHGLTIDRLRAATVVLADGRIVECDSSRDSDLFWALRGGGMGSFGVVTEWRFEPIPSIPQSRLTISWAATDFVEMMKAFQVWLPTLPDIGFAAASIIAQPNGSVSASVTMVDQGDGTDLIEHADALIASCSRPPTTVPSPIALAPPDCMAEDVFSLDAGYRKSRYAMSAVDTGSLSAIRDAFLARSSTPALAGTKAFLLVDAGGGLVDAVDHDATAFAHRGALYSAQFGALWNGVTDVATAKSASEAWLDDLYEAILPGFDGGCYPGYWDRTIADWPQAYYGDHFDRLVSIKSAYDPDDVFRFERSIPTGTRA